MGYFEKDLYGTQPSRWLPMIFVSWYSYPPTLSRVAQWSQQDSMEMAVWLLRLGHNAIVFPTVHSFGSFALGKPAALLEGYSGQLWRIPYSTELVNVAAASINFPAMSVSHRGRRSFISSQAFRWIPSPTTSWLQPHERPRAKNYLSRAERFYPTWQRPCFPENKTHEGGKVTPAHTVDLLYERNPELLWWKVRMSVLCSGERQYISRQVTIKISLKTQPRVKVNRLFSFNKCRDVRDPAKPRLNFWLRSCKIVIHCYCFKRRCCGNATH